MRKTLLFAGGLMAIVGVAFARPLEVRAVEPGPEDVASIQGADGTTYYTDFGDALGEVESGETLTLLKDVTTSAYIIRNDTSPDEFVLDLGGYKLDASADTGGPLAVKDGSTITIKNGTLENGGNRVALLIAHGVVTLEDIIVRNYPASDGAPKAAIQIGQGVNPNNQAASMSGSLFINDGTEIYGQVMPMNDSILEMNGGLIKTGEHNALVGNGQVIEDNLDASTTITINEGTIESDGGAGMYLPQVGVTTINGGSIKGAAGIVVRQGTVNINGGTITGAGTGDSTVGDAAEPLPMGAAIIVDNAEHGDSYAELAKVIIKGGVINANHETTLVSIGDNPVDYYDVQAGAYSKPFNPDFIKDENELEIRIGDTYYVGHSALDAVEDVKTDDEAEIEVLQGDLTVSGAAAGLTVTNSGTGQVSVNGQTVAPDDTVVAGGPDATPGTGGGSSTGNGAGNSGGEPGTNGGTENPGAGDAEEPGVNGGNEKPGDGGTNVGGGAAENPAGKPVENPNTGDVVGSNVALGVIGLLGLCGAGLSGRRWRSKR